MTYRYILLTSAVSKAENPNIHYRALQKGSILSGAYDARSIGHNVVVPFEKSHGERLGGSNEPYLNRPARYPEFALTNRDRNRKAQQQLFDLLEFAETKSKEKQDFPLKFLREVLKALSEIPISKRDFCVPPVEFGIEKTISLVKQYLIDSGGGERLVAICSAVFSSLARSDPKTSVIAYPVNWSDKFAKTAGDIEIYEEKQIVRAAESKDKPLALNDVQHVVKKAKQHKLTEYLILSGAGIVDAERKEIENLLEQQISDGVSINILNVPEDLRPFLILLGAKGRKYFVEKVGEYLNGIRASRENKEAWQALN